MRTSLYFPACCMLLAVGLAAAGCVSPRTVAQPLNPEITTTIEFRNVPLDQVTGFYGQLTGMTIITSPKIPDKIACTFKSQGPITAQDAVLAVETELSVHDLRITRVSDRILRIDPK